MTQMQCLTGTSILVITDRAALKGNLLHVIVEFTGGTTNGSLLWPYVESLEALLPENSQRARPVSVSSLHERLRCHHKGIQWPVMNV